MDATRAGATVNDMRFHFCNVVSDIVQRACLTVHPHFQLQHGPQAVRQHRSVGKGEIRSSVHRIKIGLSLVGVNGSGRKLTVRRAYPQASLCQTPC